MHQYALWVALEAEGFGANLQHYNPIIDQKAAQTWNVPLDWKLRSQLVFGWRRGAAGGEGVSGDVWEEGFLCMGRRSKEFVEDMNVGIGEGNGDVSRRGCVSC